MCARRIVAPSILALVSLPLSVCAHCVSIDSTQSSSWTDTATGEKHFSLRLIVKEHSARERVILRWTRTVEIDNVYEAEVVEGVGERSVGRRKAKV